MEKRKFEILNLLARGSPAGPPAGRGTSCCQARAGWCEFLIHIPCMLRISDARKLSVSVKY